MTQRVSIISLNVLLLRPIEELYAGGPSICLETRGKISRLRSLKNSCAIWLVPWNINLPRLLWMNLRHQRHQNQKTSPNHGLTARYQPRSHESQHQTPKFRTFSQALETALKDTTLGSQPKKRLDLDVDEASSDLSELKHQVICRNLVKG